MVILDYLYLTDDKPEKIEPGWLFEEFSTKEEIEKFQKEIGLMFPEKYLNFLYKAIDENGIRIYPEKYKSKYKKELSTINFEHGAYMMLEQITEDYQFLLDEFKPYPKKLIPILEGKNGNYCLDYREIENKILKNPKITLFLENEVRNRRFVHIADSYEEFLNMIAINQEDIEKSQKILQKDFIYGSEVLNLLKE